jgi:hypothetical protein
MKRKKKLLLRRWRSCQIGKRMKDVVLPKLAYSYNLEGQKTQHPKAMTKSVLKLLNIGTGL